MARNDTVNSVDHLGRFPIGILGQVLAHMLCCCLDELEFFLDFSKATQEAYKKCGERTNPDGTYANTTNKELEACVDAELRSQGRGSVIGGRVDERGYVEVIPAQQWEECQWIVDAATRVHESVHEQTRDDLARRYGEGSEEFNEQWNNPQNTAFDEQFAYQAEIDFMRALQALRKLLCPEEEKK